MTSPGRPWNEPDAELLAELVRTGALAVPMPEPGMLGVDRDVAAVRAAVRCLLANGLVTAAPRESWPEWITLDPP